MCLYNKLIRNRKYIANKKNGGNIPIPQDSRTLYVPIGCGDCIECRKQKAREWQVRLLEDIKTHKNGKFITLTFNNQSIKELTQEIDPKLKGYDLDNQIATLAMRRFLERWRKEYKISLRHWTITELGHNGTENIHIHGIIWTNENLEKVENIWKYGYMWKGKPIRKERKEIQYINYVNERTIGYITKYVHKIDNIHTKFKGKILTSPGIGHNYTKTYDSKKNKFNESQTIETYRTTTGHKIALPIYWRNKIYTEEEKEALWLHRLDKEERWVKGQKVSIKNGEEEYYKLLKWEQDRNIALGYGNGRKNWKKEEYEMERRQLKQQERINTANTRNTGQGSTPRDGHESRPLNGRYP